MGVFTAFKRFLGIESRATWLDNPANWSNFSELIDSGYRSRAGEHVTPRRALMYSPVWQAVSLISGDVAKLPLYPYRREPGISPSARIVDKDHPAFRLVRRSPYPGLSAFRFWRRLMVHLLIWNNAYCVIRFRNGRPYSMLPLLPDRTAPYQHEGETWYRTEVDGKLLALPGYRVMHLEGVSIEGRAECELVRHARDSWGLGLAAENFASKFFEKGGRIGGILTLPDSRRIDAETLKREFRRNYENPDAAFMTFVAADGVKFEQAQFAASEVQLIESRQESVRDVARWYNLPPHKLGDTTAASYSSLEQENLSYTTGTLSHWLETIASECWLKLLGRQEQESDSHFFEHSVDQLLRLDALTRTQIAVMEIGARISSPNEYRDKTNRPPYEGGDVFENPATSSSPANDPEPDAEPADAGSDEETIDRAAVSAAVIDSANRAARAIASQISREVARKKPTRFCTWFDGKESAHLQIASAELSGVSQLVSSAGGDWQRLAMGITNKIRSAVDSVMQSSSADQEQFIAAVRDAMDRVTESQQELVEEVLGANSQEQ